MFTLTGAFFIVLTILALALSVRYLYWLLEQDLKDLARLEADTEYRAEVLADLDEEVRRHPQVRRLRRQRADLRRFENDHVGVVEDLTAYLGMCPRDDTGWFELAESLLELGQNEDALRAIGRALAIDPSYVDYFPLQARAALRLEELEVARGAMRGWAAAAATRRERRKNPQSAPQPVKWLVTAAGTGDPEIGLYQAALALAEGRPDDAEELARAAIGGGNFLREDLAPEPALAPLLELPGVAECLPAQASSFGIASPLRDSQ